MMAYIGDGMKFSINMSELGVYNHVMVEQRSSGMYLIVWGGTRFWYDIAHNECLMCSGKKGDGIQLIKKCHDIRWPNRQWDINGAEYVLLCMMALIEYKLCLNEYIYSIRVAQMVVGYGSYGICLIAYKEYFSYCMTAKVVMRYRLKGMCPTLWCLAQTLTGYRP